jgi:hypothetical protein
MRLLSLGRGCECIWMRGDLYPQRNRIAIDRIAIDRIAIALQSLSDCFAIDRIAIALQSLSDCFAIERIVIALESQFKSHRFLTISNQSHCDRIAIALQSHCERIAITIKSQCDRIVFASRSLFNLFATFSIHCAIDALQLRKNCSAIASHSLLKSLCIRFAIALKLLCDRFTFAF